MPELKAVGEHQGAGPAAAEEVQDPPAEARVRLLHGPDLGLRDGGAGQAEAFVAREADHRIVDVTTRGNVQVQRLPCDATVFSWLVPPSLG